MVNYFKNEKKIGNLKKVNIEKMTERSKMTERPKLYFMRIILKKENENNERC